MDGTTTCGSRLPSCPTHIATMTDLPLNEISFTSTPLGRAPASRLAMLFAFAWPGSARQQNRLTAIPHFYNSGYMESEQAILALAALAQSTRLSVFRLLVKHEHAEARGLGECRERKDGLF